MKVYVATGLGRIEEQKQVAGWIRDAGHEITYDWGTHGPAWQQGVRRLQEIAQDELDGVTDADVVLVLLPGGRGTHFEFGVAAAFGTPTILWRASADDGLFEADQRTCAFYHLPFVTRVTRDLERAAVLEELTKAAVVL